MDCVGAKEIIARTGLLDGPMEELSLKLPTPQFSCVSKGIGKSDMCSFMER